LTRFRNNPADCLVRALLENRREDRNPSDARAALFMIDPSDTTANGLEPQRKSRRNSSNLLATPAQM
jgi:hypothetical protein